MQSVLFLALALSIAEPITTDSGSVHHGGYVCPPCYHVESLFKTEEVYEHDGQCPICGMDLVERHSLLDIREMSIHTGSGNFLLREGLAHPDRPIVVFYHKPAGFDPESPILLIIPGAGRNAWDYRDKWIDVAETQNILILSPSYGAEQYDFASYHLGGIVTNLEIKNINKSVPNPAPNRYHVEDEDLQFDVNLDRKTWIFSDLDLIFERAVTATGSRQESYDLFGHSAGGQLLHRAMLFRPGSRAKRIVAANSSFYTVPDHALRMPFGLGGSDVTDEDLAHAFSKQFILLLGEEDDEDETRGSMLHTPTLDRRGRGRFSRGEYFFRESMAAAEKMDTPFNWTLVPVEGVGHDHAMMGKAAARLLYGYGE